MSGAAPRPFSLSTAAEPTVFQQLLGAPFFNLPPSLRRLHSIRGQDAFAGEVDIERGRGLLARLCGRLAGLPPAMQAAPLRVEFSADPRSETWRRQFGSHRLATRLRCRKGLLAERLGPLQFRFAVHAAEGTIYWNVARVRLLGVLPLPARLFQRVRCREWEQDGRYHFHVEAALPLAGPVIAYHGWLEPAADEAG
ncbi:DUF4166 domain-containing protein [Pseudoxanthomonas sp. GW2]|uniref:DUF4166 domain-containing protein n=1 Tax=Pseudoxanthomonas sp. GW2 TaxID=1211114 RepID=UPI00030E49A6|nr:DUF4166 domain-containing protein [Pseudoxanthomonas sp. GW2]